MAAASQTITLRPLHQTDLVLVWTLLYSQENPEWKQWDAPYYPLEPKTWPQYLASRQQEGSYDAIAKYGIWHQGALIGTVGYYWEHRPSNWLEIGIAIYDPNHRNLGHGRQALTQWIDHLFATMPQLVRVGLTTWSGNLAMCRCAQRLGMTLEGRLRRCRLWQGTYYDSMRYGLLREEWQNPPQAGA